MAHLWVQDTPGWAIVPLEADASTVVPGGDPPVRLRGSDEGTISEAVTILRRRGSSGEAWLLMAGRGTHARVNGTPLFAGVRHLRDRDEIRVQGERLFFSAETLAHVVPFPGTDEQGVCPRCQQPIAEGDPAVCCPHCQVWHHQTDELPCWTYAPECAGHCGQPTDLEAGFQWVPDGL
jgi:hypothetical protein